MNRIKWYGPTLVLLATVLLVMITGPQLVREIAYAHQGESIRLVRDELHRNGTLAELSDSFRKVARVVEPSVVHIEVAARRLPSSQRGLPRFGPFDDEGPNFREFDPPRLEGNGSGWVFDEDGHIVTNNHVVAGADDITVLFNDGSRRKATIVGRDEKTDVAVLKVEGPVTPAARAADVAEQGDIVFAFGSPFRFKFSMSQGIVSGIGRQLGILRESAGYEYFIQTDAAINPGNSGGPLTNVYGEVVGMNTAIATRTGAYNGLGFAIPIDMVNHVVSQLIADGRVRRGYLGISIRDLTTREAQTFGYDERGVLVVAPQDNGPAGEAGIQALDIITKVNGNRVETADDLRMRIGDMAPGTEVEIELYRETDDGGEIKTLTVKLAEMPDDLGIASRDGGRRDPQPQENEVEALQRFGFEDVQTLSDELVEEYELPVEQGVLIVRVRPGSIASQERLMPGMVITHVGRHRVTTAAQFAKALAEHETGDLPVRIRFILRDGQRGIVLLELPRE